MQKIIGVTDLQRKFRAILDEVAEKGIPYVLTRGSRPQAALLPYEDFLRFQELQEKEILAQFDRLSSRMAAKNAEFSDEEVARDVALARAELDG
jgi:prevent-host-death family protein